MSRLFRAYELSLLWIVATGSLVADLIQSWARKAQSLNFNLFPVPGDPFALPITKNSDPIRGPIFIEMDYDSLFSKFGEISDDSLFQFKKAISR